jgi:hypothetical protein
MMSAPTLARAAAVPCADYRCNDGITWHAQCHGHGVVRPSGRPYQRKHTGPFPEWAKRCEGCKGTGLAVCGCTPLDSATVAAITGGSK